MLLATMDLSRCKTDEPIRRGLSLANLGVMRAVAEALLSDADDEGHPTPPDPRWIDRVVRDVDQSIGTGSAEIQRGFFFLCSVMNRMPLLVLRTTKRFADLDLPDRIACLQAVERSNMGLTSAMLAAFKIPIIITAYDSGEPLALTGFDRPTLEHRRGTVPIPPPNQANGDG